MNKYIVYNKIKTTVLNNYNLQMNPIKIWKITEDLDDLIPFTYENFEYTKLLKIKSNIDEYDVLENIIFQISNFHLNRLNMKMDESIFIEFWLKNKTKTPNMHLDCDEYERKHNKKYFYPFLSCITYLNDHSDPTFISNVDYEQYKYKDFDTQLGFSLIFPEKGKHVCFDGSKYHGVTCFDNENLHRHILAINIWRDKKPKNVDYYETSNRLQLNPTIGFEDLEYNNIYLTENSSINISIFDELLYNHCNEKLLEIKERKENGKNITIIFKKKEIMEVMDKKMDIQADLDFIKNENEFTVNRFLQRLVFPKIFTPDICKWIISEGENYASQTGGWTTHRHENYPTMDLPVKDISTIFSFILSVLPSIFDKIIKMYGILHSNINVLDMFLVKYHANLQNELELHKDGSILSFNISLSNTADYEGGGTIFTDGMHYSLEQGDMLVHCGKSKHAGVKILKGERYILVAFLDVILLSK